MKYTIDTTLMDTIDTEEKAYWLGFFYADAYNNEKRARLVLELQAEKCAKFFGKPRDPFIQYKNKGKYIAYRLELNSRHLSNQLKEKGCYAAKSFTLTFPTWLKPKLINHFVRGYFDGDGCLYIHQDQLNISIVSTKEFNSSIQDILKQIGVNSKIRFRTYKHNTCDLDSGGSRQIIKFCKWLYKDATIFLERKKSIYDNYALTHTPRFKTDLLLTP
jgi:intein-encoded DNA endonuclease-like protein